MEAVQEKVKGICRYKKDGGDFRIANKMLMLTYKYHIEKDALIEHLTTLIEEKGLEVVFMRCAHETGSTGYEHTHVVLETNKIISVKGKNACRFFDLNEDNGFIFPEGNIHPNIGPIKNKRDLTEAKHYIAKEDPDNEDLKTADQLPMARMLDMESDREAVIEYAKKWTDAPAILNTRRGLYQPTEYDILDGWEPDHEWMREVLDLNRRKPDWRHTIWYYDPRGGCGKSKLGTWMEKNLRDRDGRKEWIRVDEMGRTADAAEAIERAMRGGWTCFGIIIDLDRLTQSHTELYRVIERLKNASMMKVKFSGYQFPLKQIPHVVVFSNWPPDLFGLSRDRWIVRRLKMHLINGDRVHWEVIPMTLSEVKAERKKYELKLFKRKHISIIEGDNSSDSESESE